MKPNLSLAAIITGVSLIAISTAACKRTSEPEPECQAGTGGSITLVANPQHHGEEVRPIKLYVRYASKDAPSTLSGYDATMDAADTSAANIKLTGLKCGDYYIYMTGDDDGLPVVGAIPYTLPASASGEVTVNVPVTE